MKKIITLLYIFSAMFFLTACHKFLIRHVGGLKDYKVENKQTIIASLPLYPPLADKHYLTKPLKLKHLKELDKYKNTKTDSIQRKKFEKNKQAIQDSIKKEFEYNFPLKISFDNVLTDDNGVLIFDSEGKLIKYQEDKKCSGNTDDFIKQLSKQGRFPKTDTIALPYYLNKITDIDRKNVEMKDLGQNDFYFLITWTNWFGMSKRNAKSWIKELQKYKDMRIKVLLVNSDIMEDWDFAQKVKLNVKME